MAASYECGVADTEARLIEEVVTVCRDYIAMSWGVALDRAVVPADSDLRKIENIFFLKDIRKIPSSVPPKEPVSAKVTTSNSLVSEIKEALKARDSAKTGLRTTTKQAEDMCQQLHLSEINLAT